MSSKIKVNFDNMIKEVNTAISAIDVSKINNEKPEIALRKKKVLKAAIKILKDKDYMEALFIMYKYHKPMRFIAGFIAMFFIKKYCQKYH